MNVEIAIIARRDLILTEGGEDTEGNLRFLSLREEAVYVRGEPKCSPRMPPSFGVSIDRRLKEAIL